MFNPWHEAPTSPKWPQIDFVPLCLMDAWLVGVDNHEAKTPKG
jgi:hypothetical protein